MFVLIDFFLFYLIKTINKLSICQTKHNHSDSSVAGSFTFVFAARRTRSFLLPKKTERNGEISKKMRNVLQERKLLPNRDWEIKHSWKKESSYHNL